MLKDNYMVTGRHCGSLRRWLSVSVDQLEPRHRLFASGAGPGKALGATEPVRELDSGCNVKFGVDAT
jgi:hypothetical protein